MIRVSFYVSETKDLDLSGLLDSMGIAMFRKVARLCLRGLFDKQAADEAVKQAVCGTILKGTPPVYTDGYARIRLTFGNKGDGQVEGILNAVVPNARSMFIKTAMRQVLGPQLLMKYYLADGAGALFAEFVYVPVHTISVSSAQTIPVPKADDKAKAAGDIMEPPYPPALTPTPFPAATGSSSCGPEDIPAPLAAVGLTPPEGAPGDGADGGIDILSMLEAML